MKKTRVADTRPSTLLVKLGDTAVGTITQLGGFDRNLFAFDAAYLADAQRPTLSLSFLDVEGQPRITEQLTRSKVPPFFSNLLPEGMLREYLVERTGIPSEKEFLLLWMVGRDLPGNVIVEDMEGRPSPPLSEYLGGRLSLTANRRAAPLPRFSLAGVQMKFGAGKHPGNRLSIPARGLGGDWIVKLPSPQYDSLPDNEYSMMMLGKDIGIDVPEFGLATTKRIEGIPEGFANLDANAYYVKRFDRTPKSRIHIEDFNQIFGQFPDQKYGKQSYNAIGKNIFRILGEADYREFVRRLVFSILVGNMDMHLKNWSVVYKDGRTPRLSPAYDLVSTIVYPGIDKALPLSFAGTKDAQQVDEDLLVSFAAKTEAPRNYVLETATETVRSFKDAWSAKAKDLPLRKEWREMISARLATLPIANLGSQETTKKRRRGRPRRGA
ncbi:HipA-like protein [Candidatus Koribacter versatilis Ellin345]|uniref:HipA-like protein n=1 Tax=Koribacter versatilis (strain Ellin345) TaxID=204669 RepID=Q1IHS9_KORVE|nr:HipA domain-containing protein [Candidatus Koribacter versatilis]ABF43571.1 HipA-like protein [Candidatus Koribacter versatilis Ellin345]